jgi:2-deoxy-D-gluconate 3-dehydrogenase
VILDDFNLGGRAAIVTGGGTGIGFGIASGLIEAGADMACVYNATYPAELEKAASALGVRFLPLKADLSRMESIDTIVATVVGHFGKIDILVNNSGMCLRESALEHSEKTWDDTIQLNQKAVFFLSQAVARQFVKQKTGGKIIHVASMLSYLGGFNTAAYTASKHAIMGLTRVMASEWGGFGINVNALAPGWIKTRLSEPLRKNPQRDQAVRARIPMGDWGVPADFKGVAVLLASDAGSYINGATIPVDGGYLTK